MTRRTFLGGTLAAGTAAAGCGVTAAVTGPDRPAPSFAPVDLRLGDVRVRSVRTGAVAVKRAHRALAGPAATRLAAIALDPRWTPWLPVTAWLVEHPDRTVLVDTGETPRVAEPGYFACDAGTRFVYERLLRFDVAGGVGAALQALGTAPEAVDAVALTHLHSDHAGGLADVGHAPALLSATEAERPPPGALPCRWPDTFRPAPVVYGDGPWGAFPQSHALTADGAVRLVPTPGHTRGHQSVAVEGGGRSVVLGGDAAFDVGQVTRGEVAGICDDVSAARRTLAVLREQAEGGTVLLFSHDPDPPRAGPPRTDAPAGRGG